MTNTGETGTTISGDTIVEYRFMGFRLDIRQRRLLNPDNVPVNLSSRAMDALQLLLAHAGETISKSRLMEEVWPNVVVEENNLNQAISSVRKALGDSRSENRFILTVPGRGYCFIATVAKFSVADLAREQAAPSDAHDVPMPEGRHAALSLKSTIQRNLMAGFAAMATLSLVFSIVLLWRSETGENTDAPDTDTTQYPTSSRAVISNSVAVLPFMNLVTNLDSEPFSIGLQDEMINQLAKIRSMTVISRDSISPLLNRDVSVTDLAGILRVETVLSGTILPVGEHARISIQLQDPRTGITLWADTYEANKRDLAEMISIQGDIARHVASTLETEIKESEEAKLASIPTSSFEAYRYLLAARYAYYQQDYPKTWELSRQATELDANYFDALNLYSTVNAVMVSLPLPGMTSHEHYELALDSAERIIEIAPDRSDGYALKAVAQNSNKDWAGVSNTIDTLMKMDVPVADLKYIALVLLCLGEFEKAIEIYEANLISEPLNFFGRGFLMAAYELSGNQEMARKTYEIGEELSPAWWGDTVNIFLALGQGRELEDIDEIVELRPELRYLLHNVHDTDILRSGVLKYRAQPYKISVESLYFAALAAHIGEQEIAVELLRHSLQDVWTSLFWAWLPLFDNIRELDSFKALMVESGLIDHWQAHGWPQVCQPTNDSFECAWKAYPHTRVH